MITETRTCPNCGTPFTWTAATPRRRFCSTRCRQTWWRTSHYHTETRDAPDLTAVRDDSDDSHRCPHCRQPIALISWLVTPAAAHVTHPANTPTTRRPQSMTNHDQSHSMMTNQVGKIS